MARPPAEQFGKRRLPPLEPQPPVKRSGHVALLVMGTLAVGGGAYAMMPKNNCDPKRPDIAAAAAPGQPQPDPACQSRRWSSSGGHGYYGGSSSRTGFYGGDSSASHSSSGYSYGNALSGSNGSHAGGGGIARGGFGSFAHAISAHFSGGG
ncbi:MAG: hypothetical protein JSS22_08070 [Proteobacteria bacterium]|nr:hypothetical protein [Pseudomonadota bacterium]